MNAARILGVSPGHSTPGFPPLSSPRCASRQPTPCLSDRHLLSGFLFGVAPRDPAIFTTVTLLLAVVALIAVWLPAQRATRLDPVTALRQE
jgi:ABC-type antimicrobial peptide transport system permease subunit